MHRHRPCPGGVGATVPRRLLESLKQARRGWRLRRMAFGGLWLGFAFPPLWLGKRQEGSSEPRRLQDGQAYPRRRMVRMEIWRADWGARPVYIVAAMHQARRKHAGFSFFKRRERPRAPKAGVATEGRRRTGSISAHGPSSFRRGCWLSDMRSRPSIRRYAVRGAYPAVFFWRDGG